MQGRGVVKCHMCADRMLKLERKRRLSAQFEIQIHFYTQIWNFTTPLPWFLSILRTYAHLPHHGKKVCPKERRIVFVHLWWSACFENSLIKWVENPLIKWVWELLDQMSLRNPWSNEFKNSLIKWVSELLAQMSLKTPWLNEFENSLIKWV